MKISKSKILFMSLTILLTLSLTSLKAQVTGTITGRVTDASSGDYLPGANVMIRGTNFGDATDREGEFVIANVPPGTYTLVVGYIGYEEFSTEVSVTAGTTTRRDVALIVSYVAGEEVVVEGLRQGQIKALAQQQQAPNVKNIVSQELIERFPDENTADVLKRVPGVIVDISIGGGRYARIRGTESRLNPVTINGERLATNRRAERDPQLDVIGSSQLASVEVTKAITPDMDGDAIGGTINLVLRSPYDNMGTRWDFTAGGGYNNQREGAVGTGRFTYSTLLGANKKFGVAINANWDLKQNAVDRIEPEWGDEEDVNGNEIPYALSQMDLRDYRNDFTRYGLSGTLEFRPNQNHRLFGQVLLGRLNDEQWRGRVRLRVNRGDYLTSDGLLTSRSRMIREQDWRLEELTQEHYTVGGVHNIGTMELDWTGSYNKAEEAHRPQWETAWELDERVNLALDLSDTDAPKWDITNLDDSYQFDPANYEFDAADWREQYAYNKNYIGGLNLKMPVNLGAQPFEFKFGGKYNRKTKVSDDSRKSIDWDGDFDFTMDEIAEDYTDAEFLEGNYNYGPLPGIEEWKDFYKANKSDFEEELNYEATLGEDYKGVEDVTAYYAMGTTNFGKLQVMGGVRHEFTNAEYTGKRLYYDNNGDFSSANDTTVTRNYNNFLPMLHLRYKLARMTNIRLAYTNGFARPHFQSYSPYFWVNPDGEEITAGNPDLKPTTSMNLDFMFEHYFQGIGIAAGGFFYKNLKDIIWEATSEIEGGPYDGWDEETWVNGGDAILYGFEVAWQQELSFLPGILSGFGIFANYTHTWSDANLLGREGFLPGQAGDVGNAQLSYEKSGLSLRLSANYTDKYIRQVGRDKDRDEWKNKMLTFDFSSSYDIFPGWTAFFEWINITNEKEVLYLGKRSRPFEISLYGWHMKGGLKVRLGG